MQDLRFGLRMLRKNPGFSLVAILTLALGIGANTTIFTMVNSILLKPLPFKDPERLVMVWRTNAEKTAKDVPSSAPLFIDWQQRNQVFEQMTAFTTGRFNLAGAGEAESARGANVSAGFFATLGVPPLLGRGFLPDEDKPGAEAVVVLSHGIWQQQFGAAPGIIGQQVTVNARPCTVVGVMPPGFDYPGEARLWRTLTLDPQANRQAYFINVLARLKLGMTREQAHAGMDGVAMQVAAQYAQPARDHFELKPLGEQLTGAIRRPLLVLFGAVGFVLLIACANIANLLLARASGREREIALRAALGAGRGRLLRQLLTESLLLAAFGGIAGLLLAVWSLSWLKGLSVLKLARLDEVALDGRVFGFTALAVLLTGAVFGLIPALQVSLQQPQRLGAVLKGSGSSAASRPESQRLRAGLMVVEIALSLVLLVDASMIVERAIASLSGVFAGIGCLLAGLGVYGLMAYTTARRTHEIGVRMALGATRATVARMVILEALTLTVLGLIFGCAIAFWSKRYITALVPDLPAIQAAPLMVGVFVTIAVALIAVALPAYRASRVEPMTALRHD
ncbi:MAG: FtsX-like permease family protein, partial [Blastocatellia bacterium]